MHYLPRNQRYEQIWVVFKSGINEETGELAISKKKSDPHIVNIDLDLDFGH